MSWLVVTYHTSRGEPEHTVIGPFLDAIAAETFAVSNDLDYPPDGGYAGYLIVGPDTVAEYLPDEYVNRFADSEEK